MSDSLKQLLSTRRSASIESNVGTYVPSIELPEAIRELITGSDYWVKAKSNRYKKLIREGYLSDLLELAEMAHTKTNPANWFAKVCSKQNWGRTLDFLEKAHKVALLAADVARKLGTGVTAFIRKQVWRRGDSVTRFADMAAERGNNPHKLFAWYCLNMS